MQFKKGFFLTILVLFVVSCKNKTTEMDSIFKFRDYISYTTSGLVSVAEPIRINLAKEVDTWETDKEIDTDIIKISPYVEGKLKTLNKRTLLFIPDETLEPSTEYTINLKLQEIYKVVPKEFKDYTFQFKTITPSFNISTNNLQSYSKEWQYISAHLRSADVITLNEAKKLVSASQQNKSLKIIWNKTTGSSTFFEFKIDSIKRYVEDSRIDVKWDGKTIKAENRGENFITIPGKNNFTIIDTEIIQNPEQFISINFSDPLKQQQNFSGLVTIQNAKTPKFIVNGNVLNVYPNSKLAVPDVCA